MQGQGKNFMAMLGLTAVAVACGVGLAMSGDASPSDVTTLFKVTESHEQPAKSAKTRLVGMVSGHTADGLLIVPASDGPMVEVKAGAAKREKCPVDALYPDCLTRGGH